MPIRVLVVEDEWLIALTIQQQVRAQGYEVTGIVGTGAAALEACAKDSPEVIFMDIQMPVMDGLTATRKLMETCPHPIIIVTGHAAYREAAEQAGAMDYVLKPLSTSLIPSIIEAALERFARFQFVCSEYATCQEAVSAWVVVQKAVRQLMERESLPEEEAFARLQQRATERQILLVSAAREAVAG